MWTYLMASSRASTITARQNARYNEELNASRLLQSNNFQIPRYHRTPYQTTPFLKDGSRNIRSFRERYQMTDQPLEDSSTIHNCKDTVSLSEVTAEYSDQPFDTCDKFLFPNEIQQKFMVNANRRSNQFISTATQQIIPFEDVNETEDRYRYKSQILNGRRDVREEKLKNIQESDGSKLSTLHRTKPSKGSVASDGVSSLLSFDPSLPSYYRWLAVVSLAVFYNIIFVVGRAIFWEINKNAAFLWFSMDYLADLIYVVDILVHCHEGYLEQGLLVREANKLRTNYIKTSHWRLDLLSMLPTDLAYIWWSPDSCSSIRVPCPVIVRLNRLLRMPRMWEFFERTETATSFPNAFRICKVVLAILVLIHWNACLYFAISYALGFGTDNWVYNLNGAKNSTLARQYIYSFYWSTLTLTTIGETPTPESDAEMIFVVADFLAGVLIFATIVGNIGSMISNMNVSRVEFQNRMDGVKQYMQFRKVGDELEARVIRYFAYTWSQTGALDEERVLAALPDKLKAEIAIRVHMSTLKQVRIFQDCEPGLLEALVLKLRLQVFSPGDYICRKGDVGKEMYIVKRGRLSVVADDGLTVFASLGAGSVFGEVSVLEIAGNRTGNRRTANVKSTGYSDLFCLAKRDLWETLADYPEARSTLTERGCQLLRKDGLLDEAVFANSTQQQDTIENGITKLENTVENLNLRLARLLGEFSSQTTKLKQRITKLEEKSSQYLTQDGMECQLDEETLVKLRATRLRSIQLKPNLNSLYDHGESESFDDDKNLSLTRKNTF